MPGPRKQKTSSKRRSSYIKPENKPKSGKTGKSSEESRRDVYCGIVGNAVRTSIVLCIRDPEESCHRRYWNVVRGSDISLMPHATISGEIVKGVNEIFEENWKTLGLTKSSDWKTQFVIKAICMIVPDFIRTNQISDFHQYFNTHFVGNDKICERFVLCSEMNVILKTHTPGEDLLVLKAGVDTTCRLITKSGDIIKPKKVSGAIGAGGGAYWIARTGMAMCMQDDIGSVETEAPYTAEIMKRFMEKFGIATETDAAYVQKLLFSRQYKNTLAELAEDLSQSMFSAKDVDSEDPAIRDLFTHGGHCLGKIVKDVMSQYEGNCATMKVLLHGRMMDSIAFMLGGFIHEVSETKINKLELYAKREHSAVQAAAYVALSDDVHIETDPNELFHEASFSSTWV